MLTWGSEGVSQGGGAGRVWWLGQTMEPSHPSGPAPSPGWIPRGAETAHLTFQHPRPGSVIHNSQTWKQPECPSAGGWISKTRSTHAGEYDSALAGAGLQTPTAARMALEDIVLGEVGQSQRDKGPYDPLV